MNPTLLAAYADMLRDGFITPPGVDPVKVAAQHLAREAIRAADAAEVMSSDPRLADPTALTAALAVTFGALVLAASQVGLTLEQLLRQHATYLELVDPVQYPSARLA